MIRPLLWASAAASATLLLASLTGDGRGILGTGLLRHPGWTFVVLAAVAGLVVLVAAREVRGGENHPLESPRK